MSASGQWYYTVGGKRAGPVSYAALRSAAASGQLSRTDMVWTDGMPNWVSAEERQDLFVGSDAVPGGPPPTVTTAPSRSQHTYAGFWKRFAAIFIDAIVTGIGGFVIGGVFGVSMVFVTGTDDSDLLFSLGQLLGLVLNWIYYATMESSSFQATLGKMAFGIAVVDLAGNRVSFGKATGRHFGKIVSGLILGIGFIMVAFSEKKQGLHDMMAGCLVVNK